MPIGGGTPRRITFEDSQAQAIAWNAQGEVLYGAPADTGAGAWSQSVSAVDPRTLARHVFPLADANDAAIDPAGRWIYVVRFGLAVTGDHVRTYRGGAMAQLWRFDLQHGTEAERIGPQDANVRRPMLWRDRLIVVSDKSGRDALWSLALDGSDARQLTPDDPMGVRSASLSGDSVVYQRGADLHAFDLQAARDRLIPIDLVSDLAARRPRWIDHPLEFTSSTSLSPDGTQLVVTARGQVAIASLDSRPRVEIAPAPGTRLRDATLSPDGKTVYAVADTTGEEEIWRYPSDGSPGGTALTHDGDTRRSNVLPSPDGTLLAHADKHRRLWLLDLKTGANRVVDDGAKDRSTEYDSIAWSRDSKALSFVRHGAGNDRRRLALLTVADGHVSWVTDDRYESYAPAFSPDGHWLWFLSDRNFKLANDAPWGDRNTGPAFEDRTGIFALALQPDQRFPFQPRDELSPPKPPEPEKGKASKPPAPESLPGIVVAGLADRLYEVPHPAGRFSGLQATDKFLYVLSGQEDDRTLQSIAIDDRDPKTEQFADKVKAFGLSADGTKLFLDQKPAMPDRHDGPKPDDRLLIVSSGAKAPTNLAHLDVTIGDWRIRIDPTREWNEMFLDAWRLHRMST